jgi:hypothetical protein
MEFSTVTNELLLERGIKYDHSLMHHDHQPYYVRVGDSRTKIDYSKHPKDWMVPLQRGQETDLIEIPASWCLEFFFQGRLPEEPMVCRLSAGGNRVRTIGPAPAKGSSGRCQSETAARKAEPLTGSGPETAMLARSGCP